MSEVNHLLYEAPMGYALFEVVHQADLLSLKTKEGQEAAQDLALFGKMLELKNFTPFTYVCSS